MKNRIPVRKPFNSKKIFPVTMTDSLLLMQLVMEEEVDKPKKPHVDGVDSEDEPDKEEDDDDLDDEDEDDEDDDEEEDDELEA